MTFDLLFEQGFRKAQLITIQCDIDKDQPFGPTQYHQRKGVWSIVMQYRPLYRLISKTTSGFMFSGYLPKSGVTGIACYNDNLYHNIYAQNYDQGLAFFLRDAPLDDSCQFKFKRRGKFWIVNPTNSLMEKYTGKWRRWEY